MRSDGTPSVSYAVLRLTCHHTIRTRELIVETDEAFAVGIETIDRYIHTIERIVITAFLVFSLVIDDASVYLHFSCREVPLEILHVGGRVPQAPFCEREQFELACFPGGILQRQLLYLAPFLQRNEEKYACFESVLSSSDTGIAHAMTAFVKIEWCLTGFEARIPYHSFPLLLVNNIEIPPAIVHRNTIVAVAGDAAELGILEEGIATGGIGNQ